MFVYCKDYCNRVRCFPNVVLRDGCVPQIAQEELQSNAGSGNSGTSADSVEMSLEPAIWFKVLILDSISIDCAKRKILWTTCSQCRLTGQDREWGFVYCSHVKLLYHTDGECYDYDADLDDIFDLAACLLTDNPDNKSLLRLLHCYILPMIILNSEDLMVAEDALKQQVLSIESLDHKLNGQINQMTELKEFLLQKAREFTAFLQGRDDVAYKTNREFLKLLIGFLPKIEEERRENLSICQEKVQEAKGEVETCEPDAILHLDSARSHRDEMHKELEDILTFRESLTNLVLIERDDWYELKSAEEDFLSSNEEFELLKEEAKLTAEKKKRAVSVREALNDAVVDLRLGRETNGVDLSMLGERATDVLKRRSVPSMWQSLSERVAVFVNSDSHPLGIEHREFCNEVLRECQNYLDDDALFSNSLDMTAILQLQSNSVSSLTSSLDSVQEDVDSRNVGMSLQQSLVNCLELEEQNQNPYKKVVEKLSLKIQDHFQKMINLIQREENNFDQLFSRKIWRCYEPYFFDRTMSALSSLYERAYAYECCIFQQNLQVLTMEELEISEGWIIELVSHPLLLEDSGFVDSSGSLHSTTPTDQTFSVGTEHVRDMSNQTGHVQKVSKPTEHEQMPSLDTEHEQKSAVKIDFVQNLPARSEVESAHDSRFGSFEIIGLHENLCESQCSDSDDDDASSSSSCSSLWHTAEYDLSEIVKHAELIERNHDTLDRQKNGQRQISLVLPDDDSDTFEEKVLEKISVKDLSFDDDDVSGNVESKSNIGDSCNQNADKQETMCEITENNNRRCKERETPSSNTDESVANNPQNILLYPDNDSLYSQESDVSSHDLVPTTPLESSDDVFYPTANTQRSQRDSDHNRWSYTKSNFDLEMKLRPAHQLQRHNRTFVENFRQTFNCVNQIIRQTSLMRKLQWVTKCLQQMNTTVREIFNQKTPGKPRIKALTGDDMPTVLIVMFLHGDPKMIASLLPQLHLMYDLIAPFLENGCHGCSLTQFQVVYEFLLNKMKQNLKFYHNIAYSSSV
ncbi:uncharacterized protein [Ptychodera flava]|uniref:uncharacterized protein n=1 Tax=Ptychodera flava TaxID=63121 RepID=UPI00396A9FCE